MSSHEFDVHSAFAKTNVSQTKTLFEGKGVLSRDNLYGLYKAMYEDCSIFIATNKLPAPSQWEKQSTFDEDVWEPILTRTNFIYSFRQHSHKVETTHKEVSVAINFLRKHNEILEAL